MKRFLPFAFLLFTSPAWAQRTEVSLLGGYTSSADIEKKAVGTQDLKIDGSFTWGGAVSHFFSPHLGVEASWAQQQSALTLTTASGSAKLFDMNVGQLYASLVCQLGADEAQLKPFVFAGLGASFLSAQHLESETKLAWSVGAGVKWFPEKLLGARLHVRYNPTRLNDASSDFCDPFGFCQDSLQQFELMAGVVLRF
jgi:opacity protein-like surface antigen